MPALFVTLLLPMGLLTLGGTFFLIKPAAPCLSNILRRFDRWYFRDMRPLAVHLHELAIGKSALPLSCACVMAAAATCMICAGLTFSVGMRADPADASAAIALAPIGYVGILYGVTFLVTSFAITALHHVAFFVDTHDDLVVSHLLGADPQACTGSCRANRQPGSWQSPQSPPFTTYSDSASSDSSQTPSAHRDSRPSPPSPQRRRRSSDQPITLFPTARASGFCANGCIA